MNKKTRPTSRNPILRFSPTAWAKLQYLSDYGETEVGGFGISARNDELLVEGVQLVKQSCSPTFVSFDDEAVADFFDQQVDAGRSPEQFARIWIHTHPGDCPEPSPTDKRTFERVFGDCHWAVMVILARNGQSYARLRFNHGPTCDIEIPLGIDYSTSFAASDHESWAREYSENVTLRLFRQNLQCSKETGVDPFDADDGSDWDDAWPEHLAFDDQEEMLYG